MWAAEPPRRIHVKQARGLLRFWGTKSSWGTWGLLPPAAANALVRSAAAQALSPTTHTTVLVDVLGALARQASFVRQKPHQDLPLWSAAAPQERVQTPEVEPSPAANVAAVDGSGSHAPPLAGGLRDGTDAAAAGGLGASKTSSAGAMAGGCGLVPPYAYGLPEGVDAAAVGALGEAVLRLVMDGHERRAPEPDLLPEAMRWLGLLGCAPAGPLAAAAVQRVQVCPRSGRPPLPVIVLLDSVHMTLGGSVRLGQTLMCLPKAMRWLGLLGCAPSGPLAGAALQRIEVHPGREQLHWSLLPVAGQACCRRRGARRLMSCSKKLSGACLRSDGAPA